MPALFVRIKLLKDHPVKLRKVISLLALYACLVVCSPGQTQPRSAQPEPTEGKGVVVIHASRLIDGTGAAPINNAIIVVTDNKITAAGSSAAITAPAGAKVINLGDVTLLPGFIDAHTHLVGRVLGDPEGDMAAVKDYDSFAAILSVRHARDTLMAGFTSVRNVGAAGRFDDLALRKAINEGWA